MGIIDIDDRDVINNNYYTITTPEQLKTWLGQIKAENSLSRVNNLGEGRFKLDLPVIICTAGDVTAYFQIPFMHVFEKMEIKHVNSADVNSTTVLSYYIEHKQNPNLWMRFLAVDNSIGSDIIDEYANFRHERGQYRLITNSTNTDKLYVAIYIKVTGD